MYRIPSSLLAPLWAILLSSFTALSALETAAERPNILFVMSDDHAAHAIGAYGGRFAKLDPTPRIDRLAREGVRLSNCFVTNSICSPSRATVLTGQYSHASGVKGFREPLPSDRQALATAMKSAGYETAVIGKWHLGAEPAAFDWYCVLPGQGSYFNPVFRVHADGRAKLPASMAWRVPRGAAEWPKHSFRVSAYDCIHADDAITDIAISWLKKRSDKSRPFFLMHHFKGPHDNFENAERYDFLWDDVDIPEPASLWKRGEHGPRGRPQYGTSVSRRNQRRNMGDHMFVDEKLGDEAYARTAYQRYLKKYLRTARGVDDNLGRVLDHLEATGELDKTVVVYTADQGFMLGEHDYIDKRWMYDESMRMPFIVRYPPRFEAGSVVDDLCTNVDFAPTLLDLAGLSRESWPESFQGRSFASNLAGRTPADWPKEVYYRYWLHMAHHDNPSHWGMRTADHKLIFFYGLPLDVAGAAKKATEPHWELYDLRKDPHEMHNLAGDPAQVELFTQLRDRLEKLRRDVGDSDERYPDLRQRYESARRVRQ